MNSDGKLKVKYVVIQFPSNFLKEEIANYPEYHLIKELLERSTRGIKFDTGFNEKIAKNIKKITKESGLDRILLLQELLQLMAKATGFRLLAGELYKAELHDFTSDRLTKVMLFLNTNYQKKIELDKVAEIAHLHPSAFCRYFKGKTGKSLSEYVNDMRIGYACRLIIEGKMSISQIGFESGFNNISNFNRTFKKNTGFTPSDYYQEFHRH
jgi:AraC-like DNA-binding protein